MTDPIKLRGLVACFGMMAAFAIAQTPAPADPNAALIKRYCVGCHNNSLKTAGVILQGVDLSTVAGKEDLLERVLGKVKTGQMPPPGMPQPPAAAAAAFRQWLEQSLDAESAAHPNPGRMAIHRLN